MLQTISERGRALIDRARDRRGDAAARSASLVELCEELLSGRGEASASRSRAKSSARYDELTTGPRIAFFEALADAFRGRPRAHRCGGRCLDARGHRRGRGRTASRRRAAPAGAVPPAQSGARRHRRAGRDARRPDGRAGAPRRPRRRSTRISCICFHPGSIAASWCCAASTGRRPRSCWKRSSATRRCIRSATGTICAAASIRPTGAAMRSSIRR